MFARAGNPSDTLALERNLAGLGVYVLHGDADDNVPVAQARTMRGRLGAFHPDFVYYERPGAGRTRLALLGLLVAADAHGSISAAARSLGISQPSASAGLRDLERRLGLDLLVRGPRGTQLTETGRVVAGWARDVVDASDRFEESVASLRVHARERLRVAAGVVTPFASA